MSEPTKAANRDGQDNFGQAAGQMAKAAKQASQEAAKKGAEATANAAAATVKAGVEGGKAVSEIAVGTAVGGPWGAILSAAWAMRPYAVQNPDLHLSCTDISDCHDCIPSVYCRGQCLWVERNTASGRCDAIVQLYGDGRGGIRCGGWCV